MARDLSAPLALLHVFSSLPTPAPPAAAPRPVRRPPIGLPMDKPCTLTIR